jgi:para-nitrobenzyl esterase
MPQAFALSQKVAAAWVSFARTGNPNVPIALVNAGERVLPRWPAYSIQTRDTMLFNNESRVAQDPDRAARLAMEKVLKLS